MNMSNALPFDTTSFQKRCKEFRLTLLVALVSLVASPTLAQHSIAAGATDYTQDFNALTSGAWANGSTLSGWYARTDATASIATYGANTGSTTTAGLYAFGVAGTNPLTDRALGYAPSNGYTGGSGVGKGYVGWRLKNNTGSPITALTVTWTGEQWRKDNAASQSLVLGYQQGATVTDLIAGTWTSASSTFTSPNPGTGGLLDGNAALNRSVGLIANITVSIPAGEEIMLRWEDLNDAGNDHFLAIDDVTVNATVSGGGCDIALGTPSTNCDATTDGVDTYTLTVPYTGVQSGITIVYTGSGTVSGDDPATEADGDIIISGITEGEGYTVSLSDACSAQSVSGASPSCVPACGVVLSTATATCNSSNAGDSDTYDVSIPYTGVQAGTSVVYSGTGTVGGDDPSALADGTITISGISETEGYSVSLSSPCATQVSTGIAPGCDPEPTIINFDVAGSWVPGAVALTSYASDHVYTASEWNFTGGPALRNATTAQDGFPGALGTYSWRLNMNTVIDWRATYQGTDAITSFGFKARRWDNNPDPAYTVAYSTDGGTTWSATVFSINNSTLGNSSNWVAFNHVVTLPAAYAAGQFVVRVSSPASGERIMIDDFAFLSEESECGLVVGTATTSCEASTLGVDTYTLEIPYTGSQPGVSVIYSGSGTVGGDDPATAGDGTIVITGITEGEAYNVTFSAPCNVFVVNGTSPTCLPACNVSFGTATATCNSTSLGDGDTYDVSLPYTGVQSGISVVYSGTGTLGGDDPASVTDGVIVISGISETEGFSISLSTPCDAQVSSGGAPACDPEPTIINFDVAGSWTAGSAALNSFASDHTYSATGWSFSGGPALRNTTTAQDGFPGALGTYSWRTNTNTATDWRATYQGTDIITSFGFKARRWDGSPDPNYSVTYSTDGGATWSAAVFTVNNAALGNASDWVTFSHLVPAPAAFPAQQFIVRVTSPASGERIMIDDFAFLFEPSACGITLGTPTATCDLITEDVDTYTLEIPYTGSQLGVSVVNNSGSGSVGGDDPATQTDGTILISGISESDDYSVTLTGDCSIQIVSGSAPGCAPPPTVVINEIDYDQVGTDTGEFIELMNNGASPVDLTGMKLVHLNGSNGAVISNTTLNNVSLSPGEHYVLCYGNNAASYCDQTVATALQNDNEGLVLTTAEDAIIDQVAYAGTVPGVGEGSPTTADPITIGLGLSRIPDGNDTGDNGSDFVVICITPGEANGGADSDEDGTPDCIDVCPGGPEPGSPCDDGDEDTGEDSVQEDCSCLGIQLDCEGVAGGTALPGTPCIDGNPGTLNDTWQADCTCQGQVPDCLGELGGTALPGTPCNDNIPSTNDEVYDSECSCVGTPCSQNVILDIRSDTNSDQVGWEIVYQNDGTVVCSGGTLNSAYPGGITTPITEPCCLPVGCFRLRVLDSGGDGFVSGGITGGYQLRESGANGRRIIDNFGNFSSGSVSAIASTYENGAFCVPVGDDKPIFTSCDKLDWVDNKFIVASPNADVTAQFGISNNTSGYEFWFFDPNGTYSFRRFRNHATSDGTGTGATRACHFRINGWTNTVSTPHIPANVLMNVRIRARVAGAPEPFGPACLFKIDAARAACPLTKLQDNPADADFSCGISKTFGGANSASNKLVAAAPQFTPTVASTSVRYQFRFRIPGEYPAAGSCIVRPAQTSPTIYLNWTSGDKLKCNTQYQVDVRVSKDGGATWCIAGAEPTCSATPTVWGKVCNVNIGASTFCPGPAQGGGNNFAAEGNNSEFTMYPNPNRGDQLFLSLAKVADGVQTVSVDLFDMTGKRAMARTIGVQDGFLNTALDLNGDLAGGVYLVNITAADKTYTQRLVIQP